MSIIPPETVEEGRSAGFEERRLTRQVQCHRLNQVLLRVIRVRRAGTAARKKIVPTPAQFLPGGSQHVQGQKIRLAVYLGHKLLTVVEVVDAHVPGPQTIAVVTGVQVALHGQGQAVFGVEPGGIGRGQKKQGERVAVVGDAAAIQRAAIRFLEGI